MNELNEKIARMIFEKVQPGGNWQPLNPDYKKTYLDLADSLIDVVKESKNEPEKEN